LLPTLRFSCEFGLVFSEFAVFFGDLRVAYYWAYFVQKLPIFGLVFCKFPD